MWIRPWICSHPSSALKSFIPAGKRSVSEWNAHVKCCKTFLLKQSCIKQRGLETRPLWEILTLDAVQIPGALLPNEDALSSVGSQESLREKRTGAEMLFWAGNIFKRYISQARVDAGGQCESYDLSVLAERCLFYWPETRMLLGIHWMNDTLRGHSEL